MSEMENLLGNLDAAYKETDESAAGGFELPGGKYIMKVNESIVCKSNSSDRVHVKMPMTVLDGKHVNSDHYSYDLHFSNTDGTPDPKGIAYFKRACQVMQIPVPPTASEAGEAVMKFGSRVIEVELKKNGDFLNTRILRLIHPNYMKWMEEGSPMPEKTSKGTDEW